MTLIDSTVSGNTSAGSWGGGIYEDLEASVTLRDAMVSCFDDSSITGNPAGGIGGYGETLVGCVAGGNVSGNLPFGIS